MINEIRNTVLSVLSKDNRGYITPVEFNLFARQAQLEIFNQYFYDFANQQTKQNSRITNTGYGNHPERMEEIIERFNVDDTLTYNGATLKFYIPGHNPNQPEEPKAYKINRITYNLSTEVERINQQKLYNLLASKLTAPSVKYPSYTIDEQGISVYPNTITTNVTVNYIRHPYDPKWTWTTLVGGEPMFNASATDYQDFELPASDAPRLVVKILQYAGVSIGENDVAQMMENSEIVESQRQA